MFKTKAIILRIVKYGETSLVVTAFTQKFGVQTYMVNGVRSAKKTGMKAAMYQPAAILELEVYHNDRNAMHRIRESNWAHIYTQVLSDVIRNSIALYMMELLYKLLKQPEPDEDLFVFCEDVLLHLDKASNAVAANFPLFIALHLSHFFGLRIDDNFSEGNDFLDLMEGNFTAAAPHHPHYLSGENASAVSDLLRIMEPAELADVKLTNVRRRELLGKLNEYYRLHIPDFGTMKTVSVMEEVLG